MGYIYKITNKINGKAYIGKTNLSNPYDRFKIHINDSKRNRNKNRPLYRAFNKYGVDNFKFEIIEEVDNTEDREIYYINLYNTYGKDGYNATKGGDGRSRLSLNEGDVIKYHINIANYVTQNTAKFFKVDRATIINILDRNNIKRLDAEGIVKFKREHGTKVTQIDIETNEIINVFSSISNANFYLNKNRKATGIGEVLSGRRKTAFGYKWIKAV